MIEVITTNAAETQAVAAAVAPLLEPGDVILLDGDLGAGTTTFTQGLARALGVIDPVTSPTFTLMHTYRTAAGFDLLHVDVYRLDERAEIVDLALPELIDDNAVAVVEWGERAVFALPAISLEVRFELTERDGERRIRLDTARAGWAEHLGRLAC